MFLENHEKHLKNMFAKPIRDTSGDVWESLVMLWNDPESSRMILDYFRKSRFS